MKKLEIFVIIVIVILFFYIVFEATKYDIEQKKINPDYGKSDEQIKCEKAGGIYFLNEGLFSKNSTCQFPPIKIIN